MTSPQPKFTPGPWRSGGDTPEGQMIVNGADGLPVGAAFLSLMQLQESIANARLISAAPELYGALEAVLQWADHTAGDICDEEDAKKEMVSIGLAKSALTKARGEEV